MRHILIVSFFAIALSGCETVKVMQATGGSRANGTVDLSYEFGALEKPQVQWSEALVTARARCQAWGYTDAEQFGGQKSVCLAANAYGCLRISVTVSYQCTGSPESKPRSTD